MSNLLAPWFWASIFALFLSPSQHQTNQGQKATSICGADASFYHNPLPPHPFEQELAQRLAAHGSLFSPEKLYLHTDRSLLKPGDDLWFNAYLLNADDLSPSRQSQILNVALLDPHGSVVAQSTLLALGGTAAGDFHLPEHLAGGLYKLRAHTRWMLNNNAYFERDITLQKVVLPRLNMRLEWERKAVAPGETAIARFDAQSLDNKPLANHSIHFQASINGEKLNIGTVQTDANGRAYIRFDLPKDLDSADGLLNVSLQHQDQPEAISRAIPIVLDNIDLQFFPEGGEAVAGVPCRMGFKAVNEFGKAADVSGTVFNGRGEAVATFSSYHNGMGAFEFLPQAGETYRAVLNHENGAANTAKKGLADPKSYKLPAAARTGFALQLLRRDADNLIFKVNGNAAAQLYLAACSRDKVFFFKELALSQQNNAYVAIPVADCPMGLVRVTLFDAQKQELAERLAFVNRDKGLHFSIRTDKEKYLPRESVKANIKVSDHTGRPVEGQFSVAVVDEKQLTFADDKQGHLLAEMLLRQDLKGEVEEPNFYFDPAEPKAEAALDFLLMTQGWRRFAWKEVLNPKPVTFKHAPEKARIAGRLFGYAGNEALPMHKLQLMPDGPTTRTSEEGHFVFENVDLQRFNTIKDEKGGYHWFNRYFNYGVVFEGASEPVFITNEIESNPKAVVLMGKVTDGSTKDEVLIGASIKLSKNGETIRGGISDFDGNYRIVVPSGPGEYEVTVSYTGYSTMRTANVKLREGIINRLDATLEAGQLLQEVVVTSYKVPLIKQDNTSTGQSITMGNAAPSGAGTRRKKEKASAKVEQVAPAKQVVESQRAVEYIVPLINPNETSTGQALTSEQIAKMPTQEVNKIATSVQQGIADDNEDVKIKGSRSNATVYYIDGIRVNNQAIEMDELEVLGNGTPADKDVAADLSKRKAGLAQKNRKSDTVDVKEEEPLYPASVPKFTRAREFYVPKYDKTMPKTAVSDLRSTIYWQPKVETNHKGEAEFTFVCSDEVTNFRITVEGLGTVRSTGATAYYQAGRAEHKFYVEKPLSVDVKLPSSVISGDTLVLQAVLHNRTLFDVNGELAFEVPSHFVHVNKQKEEHFVQALSSKTISRAYCIGTANPTENQMIRVAWRGAEAFEDELVAAVRTLDRGYPARQVMSGSKSQNAFNLKLYDPVEGSLTATLTAYPKTLDDVLKGMERMLRQPNGCFEQVSSSNYPNLLVLDLLRSTNTLNPEVESRAMQYLEDGYKKLTGYECKPGGFDWYGRSPAHEALTAYGILEFSDMAAVYKVDQKMIQRALDWLLTRRDGKGGWQSRDGLHSWGNGEVLGAYIAWAMANAGYGQQISAEVNAAYDKAKSSGDLYQIALMANALQAMKDARAVGLVDILQQKQEKDGSWMGANHSVTHSTGQQLRIETTALATLALLRAGKSVASAIQYISAQKNEYGYGNTQSTVLALKALVEFAKISQQNQDGDGKLVVAIDGKRIAERAFDDKQAGRIEMAGLEQFFTQNNPLVEVFFENNDNGLPFDLEVKYASRQPRNGTTLPFQFQTMLNTKSAKVGETVRLTTTLQNTSQAPLPSPMIVLGIPSGLSLQPWQLKKLVDEKRCDYYELWDGFCVFHFESLPAGERRELNLDLRADIAGAFEAPASQAYLYYANEKRIWSKPERIIIAGGK